MPNRGWVGCEGATRRRGSPRARIDARHAGAGRRCGWVPCRGRWCPRVSENGCQVRSLAPEGLRERMPSALAGTRGPPRTDAKCVRWYPRASENGCQVCSRIPGGLRERMPSAFADPWRSPGTDPGSVPWYPRASEDGSPERSVVPEGLSRWTPDPIAETRGYPRAGRGPRRQSRRLAARHRDARGPAHHQRS